MSNFTIRLVCYEKGTNIEVFSAYLDVKEDDELLDSFKPINEDMNILTIEVTQGWCRLLRSRFCREINLERYNYEIDLIVE